MLHGYMSDSRSFYYQQKFFSNNGFFVTSPDFPGFGGSAPLTAAWSVGDYADWLGDFIAARNLFGAHIMAHSFGARVAIKLLSKGNVAGKVVIVGGAGIVKPRTLSYRVKVGGVPAGKVRGSFLCGIPLRQPRIPRSPAGDEAEL